MDICFRIRHAGHYDQPFQAGERSQGHCRSKICQGICISQVPAVSGKCRVCRQLETTLYLFLLGFCLILPFFYVYLSNRYKIYLVTNERVFIRTGIIFCNEKDIPIAKINDVLLQQGFLQMIFGAGDILIQVGNDSGTLIKDVQNAKEFKEAIIMAINNLNHGSRRM